VPWSSTAQPIQGFIEVFLSPWTTRRVAGIFAELAWISLPIFGWRWMKRLLFLFSYVC
jgi:hypothetical protein